MDLLCVLIALGTADPYRAAEENPFSRWDIVTLPSSWVSIPELGTHPQSLIHTW